MKEISKEGRENVVKDAKELKESIKERPKENAKRIVTTKTISTSTHPPNTTTSTTSTTSTSVDEDEIPLAQRKALLAKKKELEIKKEDEATPSSKKPIIDKMEIDKKK